MKLQGIFPALTTPFDDEGNLHPAKVTSNIEKLNSLDLAGYVVGGTTGETPLLGSDERIQMMTWVKEASAQGKTLIAGVGTDSVHETVRLANIAAEIGYQAALVLTPFYYRFQMHNPELQERFFRTVANRSRIPVLLYNIPQATGYDLPVDTITKLSTHPNIAGIKDSSGKLEKLKEVLSSVPPSFQTLTGAGSNFIEALRLGSSGAILAIANAVPIACLSAYQAFCEGDEQAGHLMQERIKPFAESIGGRHGIPGLKYAMDRNGFYGGPPRLPFLPPISAVHSEIDGLLGTLS